MLRCLVAVAVVMTPAFGFRFTRAPAAHVPTDAMGSQGAKEASDLPPRSQKTDVGAAVANGKIAHGMHTHQLPMIKPNCAFLLGILTIPDHKDLRNFARKSWIKHLPNDVCYLFLYDKGEDIPEGESFDGLSLNSTYEGRAVRFGEKLYNYYAYVHREAHFKSVKYIVKMDDDVVLCPESMFQFLTRNRVNANTYAGCFHGNSGTIGMEFRADEMFVLIGRGLLNEIVSKQYCDSADRALCDARGQLYDTDYGGTSLGIWLSQFSNVQCLNMAGFLEFKGVSHATNNSLLYHPEKDVTGAKDKFAKCYAA